METNVDNQERRCPRLGGNVHFGYCRSCGEGHSACPKVFDCWWEYFDVVAFFRACSEEENPGLLRSPDPPKPKVASLMELVHGARSRLAQASDI